MTVHRLELISGGGALTGLALAIGPGAPPLSLILLLAGLVSFGWGIGKRRDA